MDGTGGQAVWQHGLARESDPFARSLFRTKNPCANPPIWAVQFRDKETYGRRHANYMQRLWTGIHFQRCRSAILSGTRLLDPETLQALPDGKEKRTGGRGIRLPFGSFTGNARDLFGMRTANNRTV